MTMKRDTLLYYIASLLLLAGSLGACSEDDGLSATPETVQMTFYASTEGDEITRSRVDPTDQTQILWSYGDGISILTSNNATAPWTLSLKQECDGMTIGIFDGEVPVADIYYALSPYDLNSRLSGSNITATLPFEQKAYPGTFDPKAFLAVAKTTAAEKNTLLFKPMVAWIKVTTVQAYSKLVFRSFSQETLAGTLTIDYSGNEPTITTVANSVSEITLIPSGENTSIAAGTYYLCVKPGTLTGFQMLGYDNQSNIDCKATNVHKDIVRRDIINMGKLGTDNSKEYLTCKAILPNPESQYWMADRNFGATASVAEAANYPFGTDVAAVWGPGWSVPNATIMNSFVWNSDQTRVHDGSVYLPGTSGSYWTNEEVDSDKGKYLWFNKDDVSKEIYNGTKENNKSIRPKFIRTQQ